MSVEAMAWAFKQDVPIATKTVLLALADHADETGLCWPSVTLLARRCKVSDRTIRRHLAELEERGLVKRVRRKRKDGSQTSNHYRLVTDPGVHVLWSSRAA